MTKSKGSVWDVTVPSILVGLQTVADNLSPLHEAAVAVCLNSTLLDSLSQVRPLS